MNRPGAAIIAVLAVVMGLLALAYMLGWFGGGDTGPATTTTTPPAAGTRTTR